MISYAAMRVRSLVRSLFHSHSYWDDDEANNKIYLYVLIKEKKPPIENE